MFCFYWFNPFNFNARYLRSIDARNNSEPPEEGVSVQKKSKLFRKMVIILVHLLQLGVLWRYFKLFMPVDLRYVKFEVRDLCILRLVHAFCQSAPLLLIQVTFLLCFSIFRTIIFCVKNFY